MKKVLLLFVFVLFINTYLFADSNSEIKKELDEKHLSFVYQYTMDNKIDNFALVIYPHKIMLSKLDNKNSYIENNNTDIQEIIKSYTEIKQKKFNVDNEIYESVIYKNPKPNNSIFDNIILIKNKNNKIIWDRSFRNGYNDSYVIDIKKYNNKLIIFYYNRCYLYLDFVCEYDLPIIENGNGGFTIGPLIYGETQQYTIDEGQIISNNIIKFKFKDTDHIEYWKINLTNKDYENFDKLKNDSSLNINIIEKSHLLWYNNTLPRRTKLYKNFKNIDYFEQDEEPTIEQLKEKFPNDTFF